MTLRPDRNVQLVDLAQAVRLLQLPHPLLADDVDIKRIQRRTPEVDVDDRAAGKHGERQQQGNDNPDRFQPHVAVNRNADFAGALALVFEEEKDDRGGDGDREKEADAVMYTISASTLGAKLDACSGYNGSCDCTALVCSLRISRSRGAISRRRKIKIPATIVKIVRTPPIRMMRRIVAL